MSVGRRVRFNFEELFDDYRKLLFLFVDPVRVKTIKDVILHIQTSFNINEPLYLIENDILLPDFEDVHLLIYSTHDIKVKKYTKINPEQIDEEKVNDDFENISKSKKKKRKYDKVKSHSSCVSNMDTDSSITVARNFSYEVSKEKFNGNESDISSNKIENVNIPINNITNNDIYNLNSGKCDSKKHKEKYLYIESQNSNNIKEDTASENLQLQDHNDVNDLGENECDRQKKRKRIRKRKRPIHDEISVRLNSDATYKVRKFENNNNVHKLNRHLRFESDDDDDSHSNEACKMPSSIEPEVKSVLNVHSSEKNQNKLICENKNTQNDTTLPQFNFGDAYKSVTTSSNDKVLSKDNSSAKNVLNGDSLCQELPKTLSTNGDFFKKQNEFVGGDVDLSDDYRTTIDKQQCNKKHPEWVNELMRIKEVNVNFEYCKPPVFKRIPKSHVTVISTETSEEAESLKSAIHDEEDITDNISNVSNNRISNSVNHNFNVDDIVNFQLLFLGDNYTPTLSEMVFGRVLAVTEELVQLKILLGIEICKQLTGKFALVNEEGGGYSDVIELHVQDLINPKKIINPFYQN